MKESVWQQFIANTDKSKVIADLACQHAGRSTSRSFADGLADEDTTELHFLKRVREFIGSIVYDAIVGGEARREPYDSPGGLRSTMYDGLT